MNISSLMALGGILIFSSLVHAQNATVVFFMGGLGSAASEIGPELIQATEARFQGRIRIQGSNTAWENYQLACQDIAKNANRGKVILVGHSYGAHAAIAAAKCLQMSGNIPVDLLVTIDTVHNPVITFSSSRLIPSNVLKNYNFFQDKDPIVILNGVQDNFNENGTTRNGIHSRRISFFFLHPAPHIAMDNRVSLLTQILIQATLENQINCIQLPGNDEKPSSNSINGSSIENRSYVINNLVKENCRNRF